MLNQIDIQDIVTIAKEAGKAIMQVYKQDFEVEYKQDSSPSPCVRIHVRSVIWAFKPKQEAESE